MRIHRQDYRSAPITPIAIDRSINRSYAYDFPLSFAIMCLPNVTSAIRISLLFAVTLCKHRRETASPC